MRSAAKAIIFNMYKYFEWQASKSKYRGPSQVTRKTAEATGYSEQTVRCIVGEKASLYGATFTSPAKWYKVDKRTVCLVRHLIHDFYHETKYPTLDSLLLAVKQKGLFGGKRATLWIILRKMGFKHKKVNDKRYIYEQPSIIYQRHAYLRRMRVNRREGRPVVYLDETWANHVMEKRRCGWRMTLEHLVVYTKGGIRKPSGKGNRLIILHAGGESGWVDGAVCACFSE